MGWWHNITHSVSHAFHEVEHHIKHDIDKVGNIVENTAKTVGKGVEDSAKTVGKGIAKGAKVVGKGAVRAGEYVKNHPAQVGLIAGTVVLGAAAIALTGGAAAPLEGAILGAELAGDAAVIGTDAAIIGTDVAIETGTEAALVTATEAGTETGLGAGADAIVEGGAEAGAETTTEATTETVVQGSAENVTGETQAGTDLADLQAEEEKESVSHLIGRMQGGVEEGAGEGAGEDIELDELVQQNKPNIQAAIENEGKDAVGQVHPFVEDTAEVQESTIPEAQEMLHPNYAPEPVEEVDAGGAHWNFEDEPVGDLDLDAGGGPEPIEMQPIDEVQPAVDQNFGAPPEVGGSGIGRTAAAVGGVLGVGAIVGTVIGTTRSGPGHHGEDGHNHGGPDDPPVDPPPVDPPPPEDPPVNPPPSDPSGPDPCGHNESHPKHGLLPPHLLTHQSNGDGINACPGLPPGAYQGWYDPAGDPEADNYNPGENGEPVGIPPLPQYQYDPSISNALWNLIPSSYLPQHYKHAGSATRRLFRDWWYYRGNEQSVVKAGGAGDSELPDDVLFGVRERNDDALHKSGQLVAVDTMNPGIAYVRGTTTPATEIGQKEWYDNALGPGGQHHLKDQSLQVAEFVWRYNHTHPKTPIHTIIGHSRGGAIAYDVASRLGLKFAGLDAAMVLAQSPGANTARNISKRGFDQLLDPLGPAETTGTWAEMHHAWNGEYRSYYDRGSDQWKYATGFERVKNTGDDDESQYIRVGQGPENKRKRRLNQTGAGPVNVKHKKLRVNPDASTSDLDATMRKNIRENKLPCSRRWRGTHAADTIPRPGLSKKPYYVIVNTDTKDKPGQHWIGLCIDPRSKIVHYYNSLQSQKGRSPMPASIRKRLNSIGLKHYRTMFHSKQSRGSNQPDQESTSNTCGGHCVDWIAQHWSYAF